MKKRYWVIFLIIPLLIICGKIGSVDGQLSFFGGYLGIGGALFFSLITLENQKKQFEEEKKFQKEQFEKDKKLKEDERIKENLKSYETSNQILKSLLNSEKTGFLSENFRYLYSFIFISSPTLYNKDYFFLSAKALIFLKRHVPNINHPQIRENLIQIISLFDDFNVSTRDIINNSYEVAFKLNDCLQFTRNLKIDSFVEKYKTLNIDILNRNISGDKIKIMNEKMEEVFKKLIPPPHLLELKYNFSFEDMREEKEFLDISEKMKELITFFSLFEREVPNAFVDCIKTINSMIALIYRPGGKEIYKLIYCTSEMIDNEIKKLSTKNDLV